MSDLVRIVSVMDLIMFDAQRQGRLSFYMVCLIHRTLGERR